MISNARLNYPEIEYFDKEEIDKLPGFEKCVVMFANEYNGQTCSLDIEGNGNFREFDIKRETLVTYVKEETFNLKGDNFRLKERVRYILTFHDDKDHAEDAIKYLKEHWIPGKTKLYRRLTHYSGTIVDVQFNEDSLTPNSNFNAK